MMAYVIKEDSNDMTSFNDTTITTVMTSSGSHDVVATSQLVRVIFTILYSLIFIIGIAGNTLVVYVVVRNRSMHTITNTFISNLALSDILMCLLAVPFTAANAMMHSWVFGVTLYHIVPMTLGVSVHVSTLTSTAIAVDRYFVIVQPFKPRMTLKICLTLIIAIWLTALSLSMPLGVYQRIFPIDGGQLCLERWPKPTSRQFFTMTNLFLQYVIPCSVITYCYVHVSKALTMRAKFKMGSGTRRTDREDRDLKRKRRTNKMLIAMVAIFMCCWLPLNIIHVLHDYTQIFDEVSYYLLLFLCTHVVAMSSTIYNPFLYAWMNENFKKEFKLFLPTLFPTLSTRSAEGDRCPASQYTTVEQSVTGKRRTQDLVRPDECAPKGQSVLSAADSESGISEIHEEIPMGLVNKG